MQTLDNGHYFPYPALYILPCPNPVVIIKQAIRSHCQPAAREAVGPLSFVPVSLPLFVAILSPSAAARCPARRLLGCWVLANDAAHSLLVLDSVSLEQIIRLSLSRRLRVRVVEQVLDTQQNLLHRDGRLPSLILVQNRKTDRARGVDVGMEQRRDEFTCERYKSATRI
jgi:hypothetical protein